MTLDRLAAALADRYQIERELGAGGMATVYLAQDLRHHRQVAIKVLRPELAAVLGAGRFVQEIQTTAQLQHPHVLPLFDSGEADGFLFYVMPYVEGETLRDKLNRETQLSIEEAVRITTEVADALDYAHRHGVIHRDIKPENILLHDGRPMVADFGIALALSAAAGGRMTETGMSLGTPHYMSPEQATAEKDLTNRSDIYSLGSVLYEMLTGNPPHTGASAQQIIMKIVTEEVAPVTKVRKSVPSNVAVALAKALEKLPADRFATARDFSAALADPKFTTAQVAIAGGQAPLRSNRPFLAMATLAALAVAVAAWGWLRPSAESSPPPVVAFYLDPPSMAMALYGMAIAPDGRMVVAEVDTDSGTVLYRRSLDDPTWIRMPGTEGVTNPVFSPDGRELAFSKGGAVQVMPLNGNTPRTVVTSSDLGGITWGPGRTLIFASGTWGTPAAAAVTDGLAGNMASGGGLMQVSVNGGAPHRLTTVDSTAVAQWLPVWIPGTDVVLYEVVSREFGVYVEALSLTSGRAVRLVPGLSPQADTAGHITYVTPQGALVVQDFDAAKLALVGEPQAVADQVATFSGVFGMYSLGADGSVIYQSRRRSEEELLLIDREGNVRSRLSTSDPGTGLAHARFSPSGHEVAYVVTEGISDRGALYVRSLQRGTSQRLTFRGQVADPAWTPDGRSIAFSLVTDSADGVAELAMVAANGTGSGPRRLLRAPMSLWQLAFGPDGKTMLMRLDTPANDIGTAVLGRDSLPTSVMSTDAREEHAVLSPNGRWMAYRSNETGRDEVYVRTFPDLGPKTIVSTDGGVFPAWGAGGRTLYYEGRSRVIEVRLAFAGNEARVVERTPLFRTDWLRATANRSWDVAPDGQRFVVIGGQFNPDVWQVGALRDRAQ